MGTEVAQFFPVNTDQDQAWGTNVKKVAETAGSAANSTATIPATASTNEYTILPYATQAATGDTTANSGWAWNEASSDGMDSEATDKRRLLAGDWTFQTNMTVPAAATTGTNTLKFKCRVYRVATAGGSRTLLFETAYSTTLVTGTLGATATATRSITHNAAEIILEAGETIHVGYLFNNIQTATIGPVAGSLLHISGASTFVSVPTPGVRTRRLRSHAVAGSGSVARQLMVGLARFATAGVGTAAMGRTVTAARSFAVSGVGVAGFGRAVIAVRSFAATGVGLVAKQVQVRKFFAVNGAGGAALGPKVIGISRSVSGVGVIGLARVMGKAVAVTAVGVTTLARRVTAVRVFNVTSTGTPKVRLDIPEEALDRIAVGGPADFSGSSPTKTISGVVKDNSGTPYVGATVKLIRESDGFVAAVTTSSTGGAYSFTRDDADPNTYVVIAYEDAGGATQGISARALVPA